MLSKLKIVSLVSFVLFFVTNLLAFLVGSNGDGWLAVAMVIWSIILSLGMVFALVIAIGYLIARESKNNPLSKKEKKYALVILIMPMLSVSYLLFLYTFSS